MVFSVIQGGEIAGKREEFAGVSVEMASKRSPARHSLFHTFSFPTMSWGCQKTLRCVNPVTGIQSTNPDSRMEDQREKIASICQAMPPAKENEADKMIVSSSAAEKETTLPWNLRKRRATCYAHPENGTKRHCSSPSSPPAKKEIPCQKAVTRRTPAVGENDRRKKFSVSLSKKEIEEDFLAFKGTKPNRRPKKRPRAVQKTMDSLFPGVYLTEVKASDYKVVE